MKMLYLLGTEPAGFFSPPQSEPGTSAILGTRENPSMGDDVTFRCYRKRDDSPLNLDKRIRARIKQDCISVDSQVL